MTRLLLYTIGETSNNPPITRADGAAALTAHLAKRGLDTSSLVIDNGSGLSRNTRVSAGFMVSLLDLAWHSPTMPEYIASLSIPGKDGTMRRRFRGRAESGRMHLKTGRLDDVDAIAGYVHAKSGTTFMVCMIATIATRIAARGGHCRKRCCRGPIVSDVPKEPLNKSRPLCLAHEIADPYVTNLAHSPRYGLRFVPYSAPLHEPFRRILIYSEVP